MKDKPNGGFPPLKICQKNKDSEDINNTNILLNQKKDIKKREYVKTKNTVSIKEIIEKRKNIENFF